MEIIPKAITAAMTKNNMYFWELGTTIKATNKGASAVPKLPPTWKIDCAKPLFPPEAKLEIRADSGWKIAEPVPIRTTETIIQLKLLAKEDYFWNW